MRVPMPSPSGENKANLFVHGRIADIVAAGRRQYGLTYDSEFGLARDDFTPEQDPIAAAVTDLLNFLKTAMQPDQYSKAELLAGKVTQLSRQRVAAHARAVNEAGSANGEATDDMTTRRALIRRRRSVAIFPWTAVVLWAKPDIAQGDSHKRMLAHMRRIGHA